MPAIAVRDAETADLPGLLEIYNDVIRTSTAVFSNEQVTIDERAAWLEARRAQGFPVLVTTDEQGVAGFGSFGAFRSWPGYRTTVEHSVHVRADRRGQGLGTAIVVELIERAAALRMHAMIAGVEAENVASIRLHERLGFVTVARLPEIARKFDRWLDLVLLELIIR
jgi:L-amino acid N-acyltransferase YncA